MFFLGRLHNWWNNLGRCVFVYHDGTKKRRGDPFVLVRGIENKLPKYQEMLQTLWKDETTLPDGELRDDLLRQKKDVMPQIIAATRDVFDIPPLTDTGGATDQEVRDIFYEFLVFMYRLRRDASPY